MESFWLLIDFLVAALYTYDNERKPQSSNCIQYRERKKKKQPQLSFSCTQLEINLFYFILFEDEIVFVFVV